MAAEKHILQLIAQNRGITKEQSDKIVDEVLAPYRKRLENIELYKEAFREAVEQNYPLTEKQQNILQDLQDIFGLEDSDIEKDKQQILADKETEYKYQREIQRQEQEEYKIKLQQYEQEFLKAVEQEYPLSNAARKQINNLQQSLSIKAEDIRRVEQPILAAKYQEKLKQEERKRQKEQEAEKARKLELQRQQEQEEYENKLQQYEQEFIQAIQAEYPLDQDVRDNLKNYQRTLGLTNEDITRIEQPIIAEEETKYQKKLKEEEAERQGQQERVKQAEKLRQKELEYHQSLQQYEQKVANAIRQGISLSHIRRELRQLQQTLGLRDSDVSSIEARLVSRKFVSHKTSRSNFKPLLTRLSSKEKKLWFSWIVITTIGESIGGTLAFSNTFSDVESLNYFLTGAILWGFIGLSQWLFLRQKIKPITWWVLLTTISGSLSFRLSVFLFSSWYGTSIPLVFTELCYGFVQGLTVGVAQWFILRHKLNYTNLWIVSNVIAWAIAMVLGWAIIGSQLEDSTSHNFIREFVTGVASGIILGLGLVLLLKKQN